MRRSLDSVSRTWQATEERPMTAKPASEMRWRAIFVAFMPDKSPDHASSRTFLKTS